MRGRTEKMLKEAILSTSTSVQKEGKRSFRHEAEAPCCTGEAHEGAYCPHAAHRHCVEQVSMFSHRGACSAVVDEAWRKHSPWVSPKGYLRLELQPMGSNLWWGRRAGVAAIHGEPYGEVHPWKVGPVAYRVILRQFLESCSLSKAHVESDGEGQCPMVGMPHWRRVKMRQKRVEGERWFYFAFSSHCSKRLWVVNKLHLSCAEAVLSMTVTEEWYPLSPYLSPWTFPTVFSPPVLLGRESESSATNCS